MPSTISSLAGSALLAGALLAGWPLGCSGPASPADAGADTPGLPAPGPGGYALQFDGLDDYASFGTASFPFGDGALTISLWAFYQTAAAQPDGATPATQDLIVLRKDYDSGVQLGIKGGRLTAWRVYGGATYVDAALPSAGAWHQLTYSFDGTTHALYVDGQAAGTGTTTPNNRTPTSGWFGTLDGSRELFKGRLDEVRIWSVARSAAEVAADLIGAADDGDPALVGHWSFDELAGTHVFDHSGNGNDASLGDGIPQRAPALVASDAPVKAR